MSPSQEQERVTNRILASLPQAALRRLKPNLELMRLERGDVIDHVDGPIRNMYFVNRGFVSIVKTMLDGRMVEVGAVGVEGVTDPNALFGIDRAVLETVVQIPGTAFRIRRDLLHRELERDATLRKMLQRYMRFAFFQLAQTAACNRLHSLEERCCRWLLMAQDNALSGEFPLTHEFLAMMLGVQRTGVSITANLLKRAGLVEYTRGRISILNRAGLEAGACECYRVTRTELGKLFGKAKYR